MKRMQMPSHEDIQELSARIDALTREVHAARKPARSRPASKGPKPDA
jgi:outer membrane murein-binding lipoprotein Lpp